VENLEEKVGGGNFVMPDGKVVGQHKGYPFYTVGQRKGLDIALGRPVYVVEIDPMTNTVVLGEPEDLQRRGMIVKDINLQKYDQLPEGGLEVLAKIRYKDAGAMAWATQETDGSISTIFHHSVSAIAPGQSAVWYEGDDVIGGGHIHKSFMAD
jgi:tRNA-uridine 2-sulfurtransferase